MKNCKDIENSLSLYAEGLLSEEEKTTVEKHLKSCAACAKALAQLQRSDMLVQELKDVEPPPWFREKIMAKVREEAEKKSFVRNWFYPLRIKIPVQVAATIIIAVLAVYIYRSGDEQMKAVLPVVQQPTIEMQKGRTPAGIHKAKEAVPAHIAEKEAAAKKDRLSEEISSSGRVPKMEMPENKLAGASDKSLAMKGDMAAEKEENKYTERQAKQERFRESSPEDSSLSGAAKKSMMFKAAAPAAPRSLAASVAAPLQPGISVYVADANSAVVETEKILIKYKARKVTKQLMDGKAILQVELPVKNLKDLLSQLRTIGQVEEKNMPADGSNQDIAVVIEIINK